jgi:hypothetical protein
MGILFGDIPNIAPHMLQRAWAKERCARRVGARRGTLIKAIAARDGRHLLEVARRDDLSGLLVAVLDNQPTDD